MFNMNSIDNRKTNFLKALTRVVGAPSSIGVAVYSRDDCNAALSSANVHGEECYKVLPAWLVQDSTRRAGRGLYKIPEMVVIPADSIKFEDSSEDFLTSTPSSDTISNMNSSNYNLVMPSNDVSLVPVKNDTFVPWGHYDDINSILASKQFAPDIPVM